MVPFPENGCGLFHLPTSKYLSFPVPFPVITNILICFP